MLVLGRRPWEVVCIGMNIQVRILEIRGNRAKVAVEAPHEVPVWRGELVAKARASKIAALNDG